MGNNQNHKQTRYNENKWLTEWTAISQKVVTQQPKPNKKYNEQTLGETSPKLWHQKQATENYIRTTALERSVMNYWGGA